MREWLVSRFCCCCCSHNCMYVTMLMDKLARLLIFPIFIVRARALFRMGSLTRKRKWEVVQMYTDTNAMNFFFLFLFWTAGFGRQFFVGLIGNRIDSLVYSLFWIGIFWVFNFELAQFSYRGYRISSVLQIILCIFLRHWGKKSLLTYGIEVK